MAEINNRETEQETRSSQVEKVPHLKGKFTIIQSIGLILLTLLLSTGGGVALGSMYFWNSEEMKRIDEQLEHYKKRVEQDPSNLEDRVVLGYTYYLKGNNNQAVDELNKVIEIDENYFNAYYNLGLIYLDEEKYYEALSMYNRAVKIAPNDYKAHLQMGIAQRHLDMYEEAIASLQEANRLSPANANIIFQIGLIAEETGDFENASEIFKDVLNFDPLNKDAEDALERVQSELKNVGDKDE